MAVGVRVVAEGDAKLVLELNQVRHRIRAGAVHANLAVVVHRHESERRIDVRVHHGEIQTINIRDRPPVAHGGAAQRIDAKFKAGVTNRVHVNDVAQIVDIGNDEVFLPCGHGLQRGDERQALHAGVFFIKQDIRAVLYPFCGVCVGGAAVGRVVLEAAVLRRIVRRRHDNAVGEMILTTAVVGENGMRNNRGRREAVVALDYGMYPIGGQHFQGGALGRT